MERAIKRVENLKEEINKTDLTLPQVALKFALSHPAVSTVVVGMRNAQHAAANAAVSDLDDLPEELLLRLRRHAWRRGLWYAGK